MADGCLTPETHEILEGVGKWTSRNKEAIYGGISGNPMPVTFPWGHIAVKGSSLYLYAKDKTCEIFAEGFGGNLKSVTLLGSDEKINYNYSGRVLKINQPKNNFDIPVYKAEFEGEIDFDNIITTYGDSVTLGILAAQKTRRGREKGEKLFYEKCTGNTAFKKHGLAVTRNVLSDFWSDPDEVMFWDVNFTKSGTYSAEMVHGIINFDFEEVAVCGNFTLSLAGQENAVNTKEEKGRFRISKSSEINIRVIRDGGTFEIKTPGIYRVCLSRDEKETDSLISYIKFTKRL